MIISIVMAVLGAINCDRLFVIATQPAISNEIYGERSQEIRAGTTEDIRHLRSAAEKLRPGAVLLMAPNGFMGTGFVVSKKNRLLVTAGHLADDLWTDGVWDGNNWKAFLDGTTLPYSVSRVWYHPRAERSLNGSVPSPSTTPNDGPIVSSRFDLAVLQLSENGPGLPSEWALAHGDELQDIDFRFVGYLSFIGKDDAHPPSASRPACRRLHNKLDRASNP